MASFSVEIGKAPELPTSVIRRRPLGCHSPAVRRNARASSTPLPLGSWSTIHGDPPLS
jgi:hypothetical protein